MNEYLAKAKTIFAKAIEEIPVADWSDYLADQCAGDSKLRAEVEKLLAAHQQSDDFLDRGAIDHPTEDLGPQFRSGQTIGPYKLLEQIGEGGMGTVFMAEQSHPVRRRVALKVVRSGMDSRLVMTRFEAERQALALMDHPNIARVLDAGTHSEQPYFVMELVKGIPITEFCDQQKLSLIERLELFIPVCQAIQHAHQKGIIHRDVKPSNVLVAMYDDHPVPKIIDFGVAKAIHQPLTEKTMFTQFGQVLGTFEYMSPEQAKFNQLDIDTRSDIYSLGVLLYELLTGETPFDKQRLRSAAFDEIVRIIREEDPPVPSTRINSSKHLHAIAANRRAEPARLGTLVRGELDWIVMKALEKDRARRYETASQLASDVGLFLADEPVTARPVTLVYRARKFIRRKKGLVAAIALIVLLLVAGSVGSTTGWISAARDAHRARKAENEAIVEGKKAQSALNEAKLARTQLANELKQSDSLRLAAHASSYTESNPGLALTLAVAGAENAVQRKSFHNTTMLEALRNNRELISVDLQSLTGKQFGPYEQPIAVHCLPESSLAIVCLDGDPSAIAIDLNTGQEAFRIDAGPQSFDFVEISLDGQRMATVVDGEDELILEDGTEVILTGAAVRIWDLQNGEELHVLRGHRDQITSFDFNLDATRLVTGSLDGTAIIWDLQTGQAIKTLDAHPEMDWKVTSVDASHWARFPIILAQFSADGNRVVTIDGAQAMHMFLKYDLPNDDIDPPISKIRGGRFKSSSRGGGTTGGQSHHDQLNPTLRMWDVESGQVIYEHENSRFRSPVLAAGLLPDGKHLIAQTNRGMQLIDVSSGAVLETLPEKPTDQDLAEFRFERVRCKVFRAYSELAVFQRMRSGEWKLSGRHYFKASTNSPTPMILGGRGVVDRMYITIGGQPWIAGTRKQSVYFTASDPAQRSTEITLGRHQEPVNSLAITQDAKLVSLSEDAVLRVWNVMGDPIVPQHLLPNAAAKIGIARFSSDGSALLLAGQHDFGLFSDSQPLWPGFYDDFESSEVFFRQSSGHGSWKALANRFTRAHGRRANLWDQAKSALNRVLSEPINMIENRYGDLNSFDISPDGTRLLTVHQDSLPDPDGSFSPPFEPDADFRPIRIWDIEKQQELFALDGFTDFPYQAAFSPDGRYIATSSTGNYRCHVTDQTGNVIAVGVVSGQGDGGKIQIWDAVAGTLLKSIHQAENPNRSSRNLLWDPRGGKILFDRHDEYDETVIFDVEAGDVVAMLEGPQPQIMRYSTDGRWIAGFQTTRNPGNSVHVWDADTGQRQCRLNRDSEWVATSLAFSPDSKHLALSYDDGNGQLFDISTGVSHAWLIGHSRRIKTIEYSPDGQWIVTASEDGTARVWNSKTGEEWLKIDSRIGLVSAQFTPESQQVLIITGDGRAQIWPVDPLPVAAKSTPRDLFRSERVRYQVETR